MAVAVRRIHHNGVYTGLDQGLHTLLGAITHAHRCAHTQAAVVVAGGIRKVELFGNVFHGDQAFELKGRVHHQQALELVLVEQGLGLLGCGALGHSHQTLAWGHDVAHRRIHAGFKQQVAARHNAHHFAAVADRKARHAQLVRQRDDLTHRGTGADDHRVAQHARLIALDLGHLRGLLLGCEVFVNNANTPLLRNGDGQARLGNRVHGGRHQGQVQANIAGKLSGE